MDTPNKESRNLFNHPTMIKTLNFLRVDNTVTIPYLINVRFKDISEYKIVILFVYSLGIPKLLYSSMFSVCRAIVVQTLAQDHTQLHHKQLLLQIHPSVDPGLSPCETRTVYKESSPGS